MMMVLCLAVTPAFAAGGGGDKVRGRVGIAATVNDEVITFSDVDSRVKLYLAGAPSQPPADALSMIRRQVLDRIIDEKLQLGEARSLGVAVSDEQITAAFSNIAEQNKLPPDEFRQRLSASGVKVSTLTDQLRAEIAWSQVIRRKLRPQIAISEKDIDSAMDILVRNRAKPQFRVAEIFLAVPSAAQDAEVRADVEKLAQQIGKGAHFSDVAREFSQAPGAAAGGDLGWIQEGQLDPKIDAALKAMQPGQLSAPVRTDGGYHLLFLRDILAPGATAPKESAAPAPSADTVHLRQIVIAVDPTDPAPVVAAKVARAQALKSEIASCDAMAAKSADFASDGTGDLGEKSLDALGPELRAAVETLPDGELSAPIRTDKGIAVAMVCGRTKGVAAPETAAAPAPAPVPDKADQAEREKVANKIGMQRLEQMQDRYLRDLRATAFIEKRL